MATQTSTHTMQEYRLHLRTITNGLIDMAKKAGRTHFSANQLLRECYNLQDAELGSIEDWKSKGAYVRRGQHAYLFWGKPFTNERGFTYCPVVFRFSRDQVAFHENER